MYKMKPKHRNPDLAETFKERNLKINPYIYIYEKNWTKFLTY